MRAILSSMARSSAMRTEVDEDIRAVRAAPMSKVAASPFVVGSAMATTGPGRGSVRDERYGEIECWGVQVWLFSCIWGEDSSACGASEAMGERSRCKLLWFWWVRSRLMDVEIRLASPTNAANWAGGP